jgi:hypothetical protein
MSILYTFDGVLHHAHLAHGKLKLLGHGHVLERVVHRGGLRGRRSPVGVAIACSSTWAATFWRASGTAAPRARARGSRCSAALPTSHGSARRARVVREDCAYGQALALGLRRGRACAQCSGAGAPIVTLASVVVVIVADAANFMIPRGLLGHDRAGSESATPVVKVLAAARAPRYRVRQGPAPVVIITLPTFLGPAARYRRAVKAQLLGPVRGIHCAL